MEKSTLLTLIRSFSPVEKREALRFLQSPFFNQRKDVVQLFEYLAKTAAPDKEKAWAAMFGDSTPLDIAKLRVMMTYTHQLLETFLAVKEFRSDETGVQLRLAGAYRKRKMPAAFQRVRREVLKQIAAQPLRNTAYHEQLYQLDWEVHQQESIDNPTETGFLRAAQQSFIKAYLSKQLQIVCLIAAHRSVYASDAVPDWEDELVLRAEQEQYTDIPAITVYLHCYKMLRHHDEDVHFQRFKEILMTCSEQFTVEEMHGLFLLAVNHCIRNLNAGDAAFYREVLDLYKEGFRRGYLLDDGILSRFTYHNAVAAGLQEGELEWTRQFIHDYRNALERKYRESAFSFNLARLAYAEEDYDQVLELLQKANYRDPLLNLAAKTLLIKTYYHFKAFDAMESLLDAMRNYVLRKRVLGYHRTNYLNIVRYAEKLLRLPPGDRNAMASLHTEVEKEAVLSEKSYFLKVTEQ